MNHMAQRSQASCIFSVKLQKRYCKAKASIFCNSSLIFVVTSLDISTDFAQDKK